MNRCVHVEGGAIRGKRDDTTGVSAYLGIPYAAPPTGENRWRKPQPIIPWEGERECTRFASIPPQALSSDDVDTRERRGVRLGEISEDCLYLNVWTGAEDPNERRPVLFWIYGGGFVAGATSAPEFDGAGFAQRGVVVVTAAYRLGVLGFMAHPELTAESPEHISGNYGVWDLVAALRWTRENIQRFGGDPDQITIGGQSAGGGCTHILCCAPQTRGMFQRALLQHSGGVHEDTFLRYRSLAEAEAIGAETLNLLGARSIDEARRMPWDAIAEKSAMIRVREGMPNMPCVDANLILCGVSEAVLRNAHHNVDYMIGHTNPTGRLPIRVDLSDDMAEFRREAETFYGSDAEEFLRVVGADTPQKVFAYKNKRYIENMISGDLNFCEAQLRLNRKPAYLWEFRHILPGDDTGTLVGSEHWYLFRNLTKNWRPFTDTDRALSEAMNAYWVNFIRTGDPNGGDLPRWQPYTPDGRCQMAFDQAPRLEATQMDPVLSFRQDFVLKAIGRFDS